MQHFRFVNFLEIFPPASSPAAPWAAAGRGDCPIALPRAMTRGGGISSRPTFLQPLTPCRLQHVIAKHALAHVVTPLPSACHRKTQPCNRTRVSVFCMSLRTSAHTGAAIRIPAGMPGKLAAVWANSWRFSDLPKVLLFVLCCRKEYGLPRRFASRNDMQRLAVCLRRKNALQGQLRTRLRIHPAAPPCTRRNAPAFCLSPRPCKRRRVSVFCMSLRTSAHTGAAIRVPAEKLGKLVILRANS